jgi:hypothetical protein
MTTPVSIILFVPSAAKIALFNTLAFPVTTGIAALPNCQSAPRD